MAQAVKCLPSKYKALSTNLSTAKKKNLHYAYEREHALLVFLGLAYFAFHDDPEFHPFSCK
jgi:hypothetical protein